MVQLDKGQLDQLEYLLFQSSQGIHLLFDNPSIAKILSHPTEKIDFFSVENVNRIQSVLNDFIQKKSFQEKQAYLLDLDDESYEILVRSYFNIVDNTVLETSKFKH